VRNTHNIRVLKISLLLVFNILIAGNLLFGQASTPGGSVRLTVLGGGNVEFIFNSMNDYKVGVTYNNWTTLGISVRDEAGDINLPAGDDYTQWQLSFQAQDADGDGFMNGTNAVNKILFSSFELKATVGAGCATCNVFGSPFVALAVAPGAVLVDGSNGGGWPPDQIRDVPSADNLTFGSDQVNISYRCGVTTSLLGSPADYYSDDIVFTLLMQ
jgi:hypothetical protein